MSETVTVACKLPNGIVIEHEGRKQLLRGSNFQADSSTPNRDAFGLTPGVDAAWFADWQMWAMEHGVELVTNGLVFANVTTNGAKDQARERVLDVRSGLEGINSDDPMKDTRLGLSPNVAIEPTDETRKALDEHKG